jgi:TnpA family transposase
MRDAKDDLGISVGISRMDVVLDDIIVHKAVDNVVCFFFTGTDNVTCPIEFAFVDFIELREVPTLAYLLGIKLMPRIRNWADLDLFRPGENIRYEHIDELFSKPINWQIIETHLPDMLRVAVSIKAGRNKLYVAMRELGRVLRTVFLLEYLSDPDLRRLIHAATNKCENFNKFTKWLSFGGKGIIPENDRDKQRKIIKYNHLVANCLIFHNVQSMSRILHKLAEEGREIDEEVLSWLSPYLRSTSTGLENTL